MGWIDGLRHRLRPLLHPAAWQREHEEEVAHHLDLEAMQHDVRQARLAFGPATYYREETRRMTILGLLDVVRQDARYGWRALRRSPGFTLAVVASLALGIGANTAIFGLVYTVLLEPLPLPRPDRLVTVQRTDARAAARPAPGISGFTAAELAVLRQTAGVRLTGQTWVTIVPIEVAGQRDQSRVDLVDGAFFETLALRPVAGRLLTPADDQEGRPVVVISDLQWARWFNRSPAAIGSTITLGGASFTVVGVTPAAYHGLVFPGVFSLAAPLSVAPLLHQPDVRSPQGPGLLLAGRLADKTTLASATAALAAAFARCCADGQLVPLGTGIAPSGPARVALLGIGRGVGSGKMDLRTMFGRILLVLQAGVAIVLLIVCANVGNLLLARATARRRELAVRLSLGASRARLVRQLLTESAQLAVLGGVLGLLLAALLTGALIRGMPASLAIIADVFAFRLKPALLVFTLGISALCVLVFGMVPALRATRTDLVTPLKEGGDARAGVRTGLLDRSLVVAQVALALMLVSSAGLLGATLRNLRRVNGGFAATHVLFAWVDTRGTPREREGAVPLHEALLARVQHIGGIRAAAMSMIAPAVGGRMTSESFAVPGSDIQDGDTATITLDPVTPRYFEASGIGLSLGRDFTTADRAGAPRVAIISANLARRYFGDRNPLGQPVKLSDSVLMTVVGIAHDAKYLDLRGDADRMVYVPIAQAAATVWPFVVITARTTTPSTPVAGGLRREIQAFDPNLRLRTQGVEEALDDSLARERLAAGLAMVFGALAMGLAAVGLYGVVSYAVARRTREIGVRMALGARSGDVVWHVLRGSLVLVAFGVLLGAPLTFLAGKAMTAMLYGVGAHDPVLLIGAVLALTTVGAAASAIPAARAARVDPATALRLA
jgi:putative ABC transport system permease protein